MTVLPRRHISEFANPKKLIAQKTNKQQLWTSKPHESGVAPPTQTFEIGASSPVAADDTTITLENPITQDVYVGFRIKFMPSEVVVQVTADNIIADAGTLTELQIEPASGAIPAGETATSNPAYIPIYSLNNFSKDVSPTTASDPAASAGAFFFKSTLFIDVSLTASGMRFSNDPGFSEVIAAEASTNSITIDWTPNNTDEGVQGEATVSVSETFDATAHGQVSYTFDVSGGISRNPAINNAS